MAIKILTDSAADIFPEEAAKLGVKVVPLTLTWDGEEYLDGIDLATADFYAKLSGGNSLPTTSQPSPSSFADAYEELTADGSFVVAITVSGALSGTYQSACIAADDFEGKVFVVDSRSATAGEALVVRKALQYAEEGMEAAAIAARLNDDVKRLRLLAKVDTLEYLKRGGRVSSAVAFAGGMLNIKPVIAVVDGAVEVIGKARGSKNGNNLLRKFVEAEGGVNFDEPFALAYSGTTREELDRYIEDNADMWQGKAEKLPIFTIGTVIGTHAGPGAIGVTFFVKEK